MSLTHPRLDPTLVKPLLDLLITQQSAAHFTLDQAEHAIQELFRRLGPDLVEGLLAGAAAPAAAKKGHHRSVRVAPRCAGTVIAPGP